MNLGFEFRADLQDFLLDQREAVDSILLISVNYYIFTTLKFFSIASRPSMPLVSSSGEVNSRILGRQ